MASATTDTTMSNSQAASLDSTRLRADMSDHTLIGLLQASIDRHRTTADDLKTSSELQSRDEKRTLIMLKLAQEQVERSKEANDKLIRETDATRQRNAVLEEEVAQLRTTVDDLEAKQRVIHSTHDRSLRDVATELKVERGEHATTQNGLQKLRAELNEAKAAAVTDANSREAKHRELYQEHATLKARCDTLKEEVDFLEGQRSKEVRQVAEREYDLNRTIGALKKSLTEREAELDIVKRTTFESNTMLNSECEQLRIKVIQLEGMLKATDRDGSQRVNQLREENRLLRERSESDMLTANTREKALQQETATLAANLRAAQREINEMADRESDTRKKSLVDVVQLHAERDSLATRVASLERELTETKGKAKAEAISLRTDVEVAKNERVLADQRHSTELAVKRDENAKLRDELSLLTQQLVDAQAEAKREQCALHDKIDTQDTELKRFSVELAGYKGSVEKLEKHIRDNYAVRLLEDEVSSLKAQNVQLKNQLTHANSALASLRVEADISESSRMRTMQEHVMEAQRRVATLEREVRFSRPLLADLVEAAQHAQCLDAALERDVDLFFRQFGNNSSA
jgi:chromosome segregation ATPase